MSYLYRRHRASTHRQLYNDNDHVGLKDSELKNGKGGVHDIGRDKKYPQGGRVNVLEFTGQKVQRIHHNKSINSSHHINDSPIKNSNHNSHNNSRSKSKNKNPINTVQQNTDTNLPLAYFFDKSIKKQIIKNMIDGYFDGSVGNSGNINENSGSNSDNFNPEYRMNFNVEGYASNESNGSSGHHHVKNRLNIMGHNKTMDFRQKQRNKYTDNKNINHNNNNSTNGNEHKNIFGYINNTSNNNDRRSSDQTNLNNHKNNSSLISRKYEQKDPSQLIRNFAKTQGFKLFNSLVQSPINQPSQQQQHFVCNISGGNVGSHGSGSGTVDGSSKNNLPIIDQDIEIEEIRRPHSQQKSRYVAKEIQVLKRRQSGGLLTTDKRNTHIDINLNINITKNRSKQTFKIRQTKSLFSYFQDEHSNSGLYNTQNNSSTVSNGNNNQDFNFNVPLSTSLLLTKNLSNYSNISFMSAKSNNGSSKGWSSNRENRSQELPFILTLKQCKYYTIKYNAQGITKKYTQQGVFLLNRQKKVKKMGGKTLWHSDPYKNTLQFEQHKPLSRQLYYKTQHKHAQQIIQKIYINNQKYNNLFVNSCEELNDIIIGLCKQLLEIQGKVIVNGINLQNICKLKEKEIRIIDWSCAAIREKITNLDKVQLVKITQGTIKENLTGRNKQGIKNSFTEIENISSVSKEEQKQKQSYSNIMKWICQPEYLAPQLIQSLQNGHTNQQNLLWKSSPSASDIWSLGCLIFQILTLIPLNTNNRHYIKDRSYNRRGIFSMPIFSYCELQRKQRFFCTQAVRIVKKQCDELIKMYRIDQKILKILERMLVYDKDKRIKPQQVIQILSK